jgi:hypothetical protein
MSANSSARFRWLGKANPFPPGSGAHARTEVARKMRTGTVAELQARTRRGTPFTLAGKRLIEIEGHMPRATAEEMSERRAELYGICEEMHPITARGMFYQATVRGIVEKEETGYDKVQQLLARMRRDDELPWSWIVDNTRTRSKPYVCDSPREALEDTVRQYRKALWTDADAYVEV